MYSRKFMKRTKDGEKEGLRWIREGQACENRRQKEKGGFA